jgi:hypothetical protein
MISSTERRNCNIYFGVFLFLFYFAPPCSRPFLWTFLTSRDVWVLRSPRHRIILERYSAAQMTKKFLSFIQVLLACTQRPTPDPTRATLSHLIPPKPIVMLFSYLHTGLCFSSSSTPSGFSVIISYESLRNLCMLQVMSLPPHPPWWNHPNTSTWRVQIMKLFIT